MWSRRMDLLAEPDRHWGCRCNDRITWNGHRALLMQNELVQVVVLVDKGAEIVQFLYKPLDVDFLWHSPNPLHAPQDRVPAGASPASAFFDHWSGGWFEVVPNGGPACTYKGAELGHFAETTNVPWEYRVTDDQPDEVSVSLWVRTYRTPFLLEKRLVLQIRYPRPIHRRAPDKHGQRRHGFHVGSSPRRRQAVSR